MTARDRRLGISICILALAMAGCNRPDPEPESTAAATDAAEQRPDTWIATSVEAALYGSDEVRGSDIAVSVDDGVVTLSGTVESESAHERALALARNTEGITRVDDRLTVQPETTAEAGADPETAQPTATTGTAQADRSPSWIATKIQAQYFTSPDIKPWNIDVTVRPTGVVELRGEVDEASDRTEAVRIARATEGVVRVDDHLRVRGEAPSDADAGVPVVEGIDNDAWLTAKIQSKYFLDDDVKGLDVDVTTMDGVVTLRGTVDSAYERRQAVALARSTEGVQEVRDELKVAAEASAQPAGDTTAAKGTSGDNVAAAVEDGWITTKIQAQYFMDPDVKGHQIDVDTRNGTVTLSGTVSSDARKQVAEEIARETDGVTRVVNRLTVDAQS